MFPGNISPECKLCWRENGCVVVLYKIRKVVGPLSRYRRYPTLEPPKYNKTNSVTNTDDTIIHKADAVWSYCNCFELEL